MFGIVRDVFGLYEITLEPEIKEISNTRICKSLTIREFTKFMDSLHLDPRIRFERQVSIALNSWIHENYEIDEPMSREELVKLLKRLVRYTSFELIEGYAFRSFCSSCKLCKLTDLGIGSYVKKTFPDTRMPLIQRMKLGLEKWINENLKIRSPPTRDEMLNLCDQIFQSNSFQLIDKSNGIHKTIFRNYRADTIDLFIEISFIYFKTFISNMEIFIDFPKLRNPENRYVLILKIDKYEIVEFRDLLDLDGAIIQTCMNKPIHTFVVFDELKIIQFDDLDSYDRNDEYDEWLSPIELEEV